MLSFQEFWTALCNEILYYLNRKSTWRPPTTPKSSSYRPIVNRFLVPVALFIATHPRFWRADTSPLPLRIHQQVRIHNLVAEHTEDIMKTLLFILIHLVFYVFTIFSSGSKLRHATKWFAVSTQMHLKTLYSAKNHFHKHYMKQTSNKPLYSRGHFIWKHQYSSTPYITTPTTPTWEIHNSSQDAQKTR